MPSYKINYFNGRGMAEASRMMFAVAGVPFDDCRNNHEQWVALKPKMPFGQLPVLEIDGKVLPQAIAIENHLARTFGLYGSNNWEAATIDVINEKAREFKSVLSKLYETRETPQEKQKLINELTETLSPKIMADLEKYLKKNAGGKTWFVGNSISYADVFVYAILEKVVYAITEDAFKNFPTLKANFKRVAAHKGMAAWLAKRPSTPF